jgi:hypothetical protein
VTNAGVTTITGDLALRHQLAILVRSSRRRRAPLI